MMDLGELTTSGESCTAIANKYINPFAKHASRNTRFR